MNIKIWDMGENDWVAAETKEQAIKCLAELYNEGKVDADFLEEYTGEIEALEEAETDKLVFSDLGPGEIDENEPNTKRSFTEELRNKIARGEAFPQHFACTDI